MFLIVLYFLHNTSVLSFYIDVVLTLSVEPTLQTTSFCWLLLQRDSFNDVAAIVTSRRMIGNVTETTVFRQRLDTGYRTSSAEKDRRTIYFTLSVLQEPPIR